MTSILLADDHNIVREGLRSLLVREGFDVVAEASQGADALRLAKERRPDVAILDLGMPAMNGLEVAREIHRN